MTQPSQTDRSVYVWIPVARSRALVRSAWWLVGALLAGAVTFVVYPAIDFRPAAVSSRLVNIAIAVAALPAPMTALAAAFKAGQWLLLACWPGRAGIEADADSLTLRLGPFRTRTYDAARLDITYLFELPDEEKAGDFEAFLPEETQLEQYVPRMSHPDAPEPLQRTILRFVRQDEPAIAKQLRPALDRWRAATNEP